MVAGFTQTQYATARAHARAAMLAAYHANQHRGQYLARLRAAKRGRYVYRQAKVAA